MEYGRIRKGKFIVRPNRFIAEVDVDAERAVCHVKNTGRCRELLVPGCDVILCEAENPNRKTKYDLVSVYKGDMLINMDSQAPNKIAAEYLPRLIPNLRSLKSEVTHEDSRFDFYAETDEEKIFIEVKGVTLEKDGVVLFPDAPTQRGVKHLNGLARCVKSGYRAIALFVVQMERVKYFTPNVQTHPQFAAALKKAQADGVEIYAVRCRVTEKEVSALDLIPVVLES